MFDTWVYDDVTLYVPTGSKSKFKNDSFWGQFTHIVEDSSLDEERILGDANNDGFVNISDVTIIINYILNSPPRILTLTTPMSMATNSSISTT